jgi:hypothetical protein
MPDIPIPVSNPLTPDRIGIRGLHIRTARGDEPLQGGGTVPAGRVSLSVLPGEWSGETFVRDGKTVEIVDAVAWLTQLATDGDALAATAVTKFSEVQAGLLWLTRLRLSQDGLCPRPV